VIVCVGVDVDVGETLCEGDSEGSCEGDAEALCDGVADVVGVWLAVSA